MDGPPNPKRLWNTSSPSQKVVAKAKLEKAAAIQAAAISSDPITLAAMGFAPSLK